MPVVGKRHHHIWIIPGQKGKGLHHAQSHTLVSPTEYTLTRSNRLFSPSPTSSLHLSLCASSLCLCSQDTAADNEIIVLDEMSGVQSEGRGWPVEVLVVTTQTGDIIILNR